MKSLLVTGTDTDVGKTWVSCLILRQLVRSGLRVGAYKPVCSGAEQTADGNVRWSDVERLRREIGCDDVECVCPQRFTAAVAPNIAAGLEGRSVDDRLLISGFHAWQEKSDLVLVEGAGGLCCPVSNKLTIADLAVLLKMPIVIVAANRLGVINHTLLTVKLAQSLSICVAAVILNQTTSPAGDDLSRASNLTQLEKWLPEIPVLNCDYNADTLQSPLSIRPVNWFA